MKKYSSATVWIFVILILFFSATFLWNSGRAADEISYSDFQQKWVSDQIESVVVYPDKMLISGKTRENKQFNTYAPSEMVQMLMVQNVRTVRIHFLFL